VTDWPTSAVSGIGSCCSVWLVPKLAHRPDEARVASGAELDPVGACLAPDRRAPGFDVIHLVQGVDHGSAREQLPLVVATIDARGDAIDASPDVDRIVHDVVKTMIPDRSHAARIWCSEGAEKAGKGRREGLEPI
jgi:hypothetical protein